MKRKLCNDFTESDQVSNGVVPGQYILNAFISVLLFKRFLFIYLFLFLEFEQLFLVVERTLNRLRI